MRLDGIMTAVSAEVHLGSTRSAQQARSQLKLERVLEATRDILETQGPEGLTVAEVATRAGVSTGWLYSYFDTLDGLVEEIVVSGLRELDAALDEVGFELSGPGWRSKAERGVDACIQYYDTHAGFRRVWFSAQFSGRLTQANRLHDNLLADHLAASVTDPRDVAPAASLRTVMRTFVGIIDKGIDLAYRDDPDRADPELIAELRRASVAYLETFLD